MEKKSAEALVAIVALLFFDFGTTRLCGDDSQSAMPSSAQPKVFNITAFGAVGDGVAMDTEAIQKTIDACSAAGGGILRVPAGDFQIGTIR